MGVILNMYYSLSSSFRSIKDHKTQFYSLGHFIKHMEYIYLGLGMNIKQLHHGCINKLNFKKFNTHVHINSWQSLKISTCNRTTTLTWVHPNPQHKNYDSTLEKRILELQGQKGPFDEHFTYLGWKFLEA